MSPAIGFCLVVVLTASGAHADAASDAADLNLVLDAALYPVQVMSYCYREIDPNRDFQQSGIDWYVRNEDVIELMQPLASAAGITDASRAAADREGLMQIEAKLASIEDKPAWCRQTSKTMDYGGFDLEERADILPILKRLLPDRYVAHPAANP